MPRDAKLDREIDVVLRTPDVPILGPSGDFRVEFRDLEGRHVLSERAPDYEAALRVARDGILGTSGDEARIFFGDDLVNIGRIERARIRGRGEKFMVRFARGGEKPRKARAHGPRSLGE